MFFPTKSQIFFLYNVKTWLIEPHHFFASQKHEKWGIGFRA